MAWYDVLPPFNALTFAGRKLMETTPMYGGQRRQPDNDPAATQNAVDGARAATTKTSAPATQAAPAASRVAIPSGSVANRAPNADVPYPGGMALPSLATPQRVDTTDAAPNLRFAQAPQAEASRDPFDPAMYNQLQELDYRIGELSNAKGLADTWRRGQLRKARSRLVGDATRLAGARSESRAVDTAQFRTQIDAMRAANEVPLAQLSDFTQRRGQTLAAQTANMRDMTERYGIDTRDATERLGIDVRSSDTRRGQDLDFMPRLGQVAAGSALYKAINSGASLEDVADVAAAVGLSNPRAAKGPTTEKVGLPTGGEALTITMPDGTTRVMLPEEIVRLGKLPRQNATTDDLKKRGLLQE